MGWNGSGVLVRTNGVNTGVETWQDDATAATKIRADRHDTHDQDLSDSIQACITKNNESKPTAHFLPNVSTSYNLGSATYKWGNLHLSGNILIDGTVDGRDIAADGVTLDALVNPSRGHISGSTVDAGSLPAGWTITSSVGGKVLIDMGTDDLTDYSYSFTGENVTGGTVRHNEIVYIDQSTAQALVNTFEIVCEDAAGSASTTTHLFFTITPV